MTRTGRDEWAKEAGSQIVATEDDWYYLARADGPALVADTTGGAPFAPRPMDSSLDAGRLSGLR